MNIEVCLNAISENTLGEKIDKGNKYGQVSGLGTEFSIEVFLHNIQTAIIGFDFSLEFPQHLVSLVSAEGPISLLRPATQGNITFGGLNPVEIPKSGYAATLVFKTLVDTTDKQFTIILNSLTIGDNAFNLNTIAGKWGVVFTGRCVWTLEERATGLTIILLKIMKTMNTESSSLILSELEKDIRECFMPIDPLIRPTDRSGVGRFLEEFVKNIDN